MNLIRGSGIDGLTGMKPIISDFRFHISDSENKPQIALVRPLLGWATRAETENFCQFNEVLFRKDSMNEDLNFRRVRIRKILLPALQEFNPKIVETLAKTANLLQIESEASLKSDDQRPNFETDFLSLRDLRALSKASLYRLLRRWLEVNQGNLRQLESKHIEAVESLIFSRKSGKIVELPGGVSILKERGKLFFKRKNIENID
jgi:tRNA(Ile)-lysidine synthase